MIILLLLSTLGLNGYLLFRLIQTQKRLEGIAQATARMVLLQEEWVKLREVLSSGRETLRERIMVRNIKGDRNG